MTRSSWRSCEMVGQHCSIPLHSKSATQGLYSTSLPFRLAEQHVSLTFRLSLSIATCYTGDRVHDQHERLLRPDRSLLFYSSPCMRALMSSSRLRCHHVYLPASVHCAYSCSQSSLRLLQAYFMFLHYASVDGSVILQHLISLHLALHRPPLKV